LRYAEERSRNVEKENLKTVMVKTKQRERATTSIGLVSGEKERGRNFCGTKPETTA